MRIRCCRQERKSRRAACARAAGRVCRGVVMVPPPCPAARRAVVSRSRTSPRERIRAGRAAGPMRTGGPSTTGPKATPTGGSKGRGGARRGLQMDAAGVGKYEDPAVHRRGALSLRGAILRGAAPCGQGARRGVLASSDWSVACRSGEAGRPPEREGREGGRDGADRLRAPAFSRYQQAGTTRAAVDSRIGGPRMSPGSRESRRREAKPGPDRSAGRGCHRPLEQPGFWPLKRVLAAENVTICNLS